MALHEGCRRLRKAGKLLIFCCAGFLLLGIILLSIGYGIGLPNVAELSPMLFGATLFTGFWGVALWFLGRVIEGFARPSSKESDQPR